MLVRSASTSRLQDWAVSQALSQPGCGIVRDRVRTCLGDVSTDSPSYGREPIAGAHAGGCSTLESSRQY